jgi:phosphoribosyl 1,2-cyclic phosphodiesterase
LASSSAGNCILVATQRTRVLIDAGICRREVKKRLADLGEDLAAVDAILLTHEHSDHTSGVCAVMKRTRDERVPIYLTHGTADAMDWDEGNPVLERFQAGCSFTVGDFDVSSFTIPHDAVDPVGFCLRAQGVKVSIATDLGYVTDSLRMHLRGSDVVMLESNHDLEMLRVGPYPWSVKQRVMSRRGHLSNEVAADFIRNDLDTTVSTVILGHISEHNNHPELVRAAGAKALDGRALFTRLMVVEPGIAGEAVLY